MSPLYFSVPFESSKDIWVIYPSTLYVQNFNINIIIIECYKEISAIGKEGETFPATFDFSIAFKSNYLKTVQNLLIDSMVMDFHEFPVTLHAEFYL